MAGCQTNSIMHLETIEQGNIFTPEMVAQIQVGMDAEQVRSILGEPVLQTPFHPNHWVYVTRTDHRYGNIEQRSLTIIFDDGEVQQILRRG
jgi:outer membrane protein assembly factor BamE